MPIDELHRIRYGWTTGPAGPSQQGDGSFVPLASSFTEPQALALWERRVGPWLRTAPEGRRPPPSLFYTSFKEDAVLIHRRRTREPTGETANLLIGPIDVLTPRVALGLHNGVWCGRKGLAGETAKIA